MWDDDGELGVYLKAFCSRCMQSGASGKCFLAWRNFWTWGSRLLLGGNRPVQSHSSSQPFSSLYLRTDATAGDQLCFGASTNFSNVNARLLHLSHLLDVIICELFENLAEDLVLERLGLQRSFKYLIGELVDRSHPFGWVVAHILHHRCGRSQGCQPLTWQLIYWNRAGRIWIKRDVPSSAN